MGDLAKSGSTISDCKGAGKSFGVELTQAGEQQVGGH